jgi:hypothetical protein
MNAATATLKPTRAEDERHGLDATLVWLDQRITETSDPEVRAHFVRAMDSIDREHQSREQYSRIPDVDHGKDVHVQNGTVMVRPSGSMFTYLEPDPATIHPQDIAHHLARIRRFSAGSDATVAQHSVVGAQLLDEPLYKRCFLLHDAEEYVMGDMPAPLKRLVGGNYRQIAEVIRCAIFRKFERPIAWATRLPKAVKDMDGMLLEWERRDQMPNADWMKKQPLEHLGPYTAWSTETAQSAFLQMFWSLFPNHKT